MQPSDRRMRQPGERVASITVAFNPDPLRLARQLRALRGQVDDVVVVDNGAGTRPDVAGDPAAQVIEMRENRGVASAFNVGMRAARLRGARFALLMDHDSIPCGGMVDALLAGYREATLRSPAPVAAVGPRVHDVRDRTEYPFIRLGWLRNRHLRPAQAIGGLIECDFLISSGTLVALDHLEAIGEFDESLFIDSVDLEWSCRARSRGFRLVGVCAARLDHWLGDARRKVMPGVELVVHAPERIYYMTRNRLLLYRRPYVPLKWKAKDVLRLLAKFTATMLFMPARAEYRRMTMRALRDGMMRMGGKYGSPTPIRR